MIASKVNVTFELTIVATISALLVGVVIAIIGYYKIPALYRFARVYVSIMRGTPIVAQLYFFNYRNTLLPRIARLNEIMEVDEMGGGLPEDSVGYGSGTQNECAPFKISSHMLKYFQTINERRRL